MASDSAPRGTLGTVHNAATLLELLASGPAHQQLTDLAERSGMSLPTLHRLLRSLVAAGLVEQDPRTARYGLGPVLVLLAERYLSRLPVLTAAGPYLVELRNATKGTVSVAILVNDDVVTVDRVDGEDAGGVFRDASRVRPAVRTAAGRVLLAHSSYDDTWQRATDALQVRREDWAGDTVVWDPATAADVPEIAAPLRAGDGTVVAALSVTGGAAALDAEHLNTDVGPHLVRAATTISRALGHG
jgi:IclR family transcriptional regulator, acetate operon repressor